MAKTEWNTKGRIFDIQRFSIHDGPGIRTIVFLKGCYFRCRWCCNPESQEYEIQTAVVNNKQKIYGQDVTVEEVMEEVNKDAVYYRRTKGGLTLSGGEPLFQPEFAKALYQCAHECNMNTAIETTAGVPFPIIEKILPDIDYFMMDIKHVDGQKHKEFIGQSNELILENARKIGKIKKNLIIRTPVIPTFNNTPEDIRAIAQAVAGIPGVTEHHLLPYHRLGQDKYARLGMEYSLSHIKPMEEGYMEMLLEEAKKSGLYCQIGG